MDIGPGSGEESITIHIIIILFSGPARTFHHHTSQNVAQHLAMYTGGDRKMFVTFQHGHTNWANLCLDNRDIGYQMDQQQDCSTDVAMITDKFTELYSGKNSFYLLNKSKHCVSRHQLGRQFCLWVSCNGHPTQCQIPQSKSVCQRAILTTPPPQNNHHSLNKSLAPPSTLQMWWGMCKFEHSPPLPFVNEGKSFGN